MNEEYYINQCSGKTKIASEATRYGFINTYKVNGGTVTLTFQQYANGDDDYDDELVDVKIKKSLLQNLKEMVALNPLELLGK